MLPRLVPTTSTCAAAIGWPDCESTTRPRILPVEAWARADVEVTRASAVVPTTEKASRLNDSGSMEHSPGRTGKGLKGPSPGTTTHPVHRGRGAGVHGRHHARGHRAGATWCAVMPVNG